MAKTKRVNTEALGKLSRKELRKRIKDAGSAAALARQIGVASSTVRTWSYLLNK